MFPSYSTRYLSPLPRSSYPNVSVKAWSRHRNRALRGSRQRFVPKRRHVTQKREAASTREMAALCIERASSHWHFVSLFLPGVRRTTACLQPRPTAVHHVRKRYDATAPSLFGVAVRILNRRDRAEDGSAADSSASSAAWIDEAILRARCSVLTHRCECCACGARLTHELRPPAASRSPRRRIRAGLDADACQAAIRAAARSVTGRR